MWKKFAYPRATLSVPLKTASCPQKLRSMRTIHEGKPFPFDQRLRHWLPIQFCQLRFEIEQFELTRPPRHEQKNNILRPRLKTGSLRLHRVRQRLRQRISVRQQRSQRDRSQSQPAPAEKVPSRQILHWITRSGHRFAVTPTLPATCSFANPRFMCFVTHRSVCHKSLRFSFHIAKTSLTECPCICSIMA